MTQINNVAKVLLLNTQDEALLLKRSGNDSYKPERLDYPGGGIDVGESPADAAVRELKEEAGIDVAVPNLRLIYTGTAYDDTFEDSINRFFYVCKITDDQKVILSDEHNDFLWVPIAQVDSVFKHWFYSAGIKHAVQYGLLP